MRSCEVNGRSGYFHTWEQFSEIIEPSLLRGGHSGGVFARVYGIVEFTSGVERVNPTEIKFVDEEHSFLVGLENFTNKLKENHHD